MSIRILTFYDQKGWAWWHRAHHLKNHFNANFELTILQNGQPFNEVDFDFILLFEHYLLNMIPNAPRKKIIMGSSCPKLSDELVDRLLKEKCLAGMVNNLGAYRQISEKLNGVAKSFCCQNGVDEKLFFPKDNSNPNNVIACWVGNSKSIGNKGLDLIEAACAQMNLTLYILDSADPQNKSLTQEEVRDQVYHQSTFYICASEFEGTPNPMLESLSCGLPVITTRVGNAPEIIVDGYNGFIVDRSVAGIVGGIQKLLSSNINEMGVHARESILNGWTWKHRVKQYEVMFTELQNKSAPNEGMQTSKSTSKKSGFTGMVEVPFLASKQIERKLYLNDLITKADSLKNNPNDFDTVLCAALDSIRLGDYKLAKEFTSSAASMTRYYNEIIRDMSHHIQVWEQKQSIPSMVDPTKVLGNGKIRVAMLTYNALEYTKQCIHTLLTRTRRPLEIHIRENASQDDTVEWLRQLNHPQVHVEFGEENRGVPGGRNCLIRMIAKVASPEDFVVFLDNDIEMLEGWDDHYLEFFAEHPEVGIASAVGQRMVVREVDRHLHDPNPGPAPVDVALGGYACWMRVPAMLRVGGYDENLGLFWHEDDDFCVRAIGLGIDVWAVPGAPLIHHGHKSGVALTGLSQGGSPKNQAYLVNKWREMGLVLANGEIDRARVGKWNNRRKWKLDPHAIVIGYSMDMSLDIEVQNPTDIVHTFLKVFENDFSVHLVIQIINKNWNVETEEYVNGFMKLTRDFKNIKIQVEDLSSDESLEFKTCWDIGFYLNNNMIQNSEILDCLELGIPTITTSIQYGEKLKFGDALVFKSNLDEVEVGLLELVNSFEARKTYSDNSKRFVKKSGQTFFENKLLNQGSVDWGEKAGEHESNPIHFFEFKKLKILLQNRPTAVMSPGGDTMVMDNYAELLKKSGHSVDVCLDSNIDYLKFDIVHLFNLVLPAVLEPMAMAALKFGTPFVVQALQEDQTRYLGRSLAFTHAIGEYVSAGQPRQLRTEFLANAKLYQNFVSDSSKYVAQNAKVLICNSKSEMSYVKALHPESNCVVNNYGLNHSHKLISAELFENTFGIKDFILCVGRLEYRKNQLALMAALEEDDIPLVFADGGVNYFPDYANFCRRFKRKGRTIFTGRLSPELLSSCFSAAHAHILPSWQELPGLVTMEAAMHGCNVAATTEGGIQEYLGEACVYFEPDDVEGIRRVVHTLLNTPKSFSAAKKVEKFTWEKSTKNLVEIYNSVLSLKN